MSRTIEIAVPPELRREILARLAGPPGIAGVSLQPDASQDPPGDLLTLRATNEGAMGVLRLLAVPLGTKRLVAHRRRIFD